MKMDGLEGRTILITRPAAQSQAFQKRLEAAGARTITVPTIEIVPRDGESMRRVIQNLATYDWLIFTSANGAQIFFDFLEENGEAAELPPVCAIGPGTATRIRDLGQPVDLIPSFYQAEGIIEAFQQQYGEDLSSLKILIPRASRARETLPRHLRALGAQVEVLHVYDTGLPEENRHRLNEILDQDPPDLITFTSSSTVRNFAALTRGRKDLDRFDCAAIGPITAHTLEDHGLKLSVESTKATVEDLADAIQAYFDNR